MMYQSYVQKDDFALRVELGRRVARSQMRRAHDVWKTAVHLSSAVHRGGYAARMRFGDTIDFVTHTVHLLAFHIINQQNAFIEIQ
jgi:hypothetical protein